MSKLVSFKSGNFLVPAKEFDNGRVELLIRTNETTFEEVSVGYSASKMFHDTVYETSEILSITKLTSVTEMLARETVCVINIATLRHSLLLVLSSLGEDTELNCDDILGKIRVTGFNVNLFNNVLTITYCKSQKSSLLVEVFDILNKVTATLQDLNAYSYFQVKLYDEVNGKDTFLTETLKVRNNEVVLLHW